ncbi:MAG: lipopolysaccharide assembly protein LapB [Betaproteobacteria bacterium]|nr:lipopolysaccharide assembly protein LapB [Betaproteobacteria bacterium]MBP6645200.1 lipopolysaccharide assembly protein LapB [Burkholderiaceae bacterium]
MEFDLSWILLGLPLAFGLGWMASRLDWRQLRIENRHAPKAYFRGLNFLLNEQQDKAIDAFIEAVQNDPDTSELHFALGNLFRRRGEYERAVRVHEHLLARADLGVPDRQRAQHALAMDFLKAGLLDRAESALRKLYDTPFESEAAIALLAIYERSRDWSQAAAIASHLEASGQGQFGARRAHYLCEQAAKVPADQATALLQQASRIACQTPRPGIELAALQMQAGLADDAFQALAATAQTVPGAMPLIAKPLAAAAIACHRQNEARQILSENYAQTATLDVMDALVTLDEGKGTPRNWYLRHLEREPSLIAAAQWIAGEKLEHEQFHPQVQRALDHAVKPLSRYRCAACGFEARQHFWQCPGCQSWDSYPSRRVEEL